MPTTIAVSPSPQGHEQRRVSSPPQAKFGRGPAQQKILTVVLAQHHRTLPRGFSVIFAFGHRRQRTKLIERTIIVANQTGNFEPDMVTSRTGQFGSELLLRCAGLSTSWKVPVSPGGGAVYAERPSDPDTSVPDPTDYN